MKTLNKTEVTIEILRNKCENVESQTEADILVSLLENIIQDYEYGVHSLSASETNVLKNVAIIRTPDYSLDLINPKIIQAKNKVVSFQEHCASFGKSYNCLRYNTIIIENGFKKELVKLEGYFAFLVQHAIDHLNGIIYHDRVIKFAVVRNEGKILERDFCPCASKKKFNVCCKGE